MKLIKARTGLTFIIGFFLIQTVAYSQSSRKMKFVEYETVVEDLLSSDSLRELQHAYDYTAVLLLDSSKIELVLQTGFQYLEEFRNSALGLSQVDQTLGFVTSKDEIKELFQDQKSLERILECTHSSESTDIEMSEFDNPIYFKGDEAVFRMSGPTWSDTYYARLKNGVLQIKWLGGAIE